jgi:hypothetical protein
MMELVDMLGLGSSSLKNRGSSPLFGSSIITFFKYGYNKSTL